MKTNPALKFSLLAILALAAALITGCRTTKPVDWDSRVGSYTFDQAVIELGPPDKQARLTNSNTVAQWIKHSSGGSSFGVGTGFYTGHMGVGVGQGYSPAYRDRILTLTFGPDNKLAYWSKNY